MRSKHSIDDLMTRIDQDARGFLEVLGNVREDRLRPAEPDREWLRLSADSVDLRRAGRSLTVTVHGRVEGLPTADMTGGTLSGVFGAPTGEVKLRDRFEITSTWNLNAAPTSQSKRSDMLGVTMPW
ncbi:hypothetical protein [Actinoplanes xinjiangensis]|uniref:hypothetical protein n=1 Tax=Actinoplanes xinjiangensis TaxID=512350 RepID=UPI00343A72AF